MTIHFGRGEDEKGVTKVPTSSSDGPLSHMATNTTSSTDSYDEMLTGATRARAPSSVDGSMSISSDEKSNKPISEEYSADMQPLQFKMSRRRTTPLHSASNSVNAHMYRMGAQPHANSQQHTPQPPLNIRADSNPSPFTTPRPDPIKSLRFDEGNLSSTTAGDTTTSTAASDPSKVESQRDAFAKVREHIQRGSATNSTGFFKSDFNPFAFIDSEQFETYLKEPRYIKIFKRRSRSAKQFRRLFLAQELKTAPEPSEIDTAIANGLIAPGVADNLQPNVSIGNATLNGNNFRDNIADTSNDNQSDSTICGGLPNLQIGGGNHSNEVATNTKAIWSTKFSLDGKYMATGSRDGSIRIWKVLSSPVERWGIDSSLESGHLSSAKSMRLQQNYYQAGHGASPSLKRDTFDSLERENSSNLYAPVFHPSPMKTFREHEQDVLDVDWSKNSFLLSASMDKTVKLWHPLKRRSLKSFSHPDFVTCVKFHPTDDRFFISGCLDQKCRLWSILDNEVSFEFNCRDLVTSLTLSPGDGIYTIVGTFNGYIHVLQTKGLEHITSFHVTAKKTHENTQGVLNPNNDTKVRHGPRVTGLQCFNSLIDGSLRLVVTSSDSRIRIFDLTRRKLLEILRGFQCGSSQHRAQLSVFHNQPVVVSSSDDHWVYGWRLKSSDPVEINKKAKKPNMTRSGSIRSLFSKSISRSSSQGSEEKQSLRNSLKLTSLLPMPHSSHHGDGSIKNSEYFSFHAHNAPVTTVAIAPEETSKTLSLSNDPICELSLEFFEPTDEVEIIKMKNRAPLDGSDGHTLSSGSTATSLSRPTPVEAIGTILISTDNNGLIRVFRADMSKTIRSRVLEKLHTYNTELSKQYGSSESLISEHDKPRTSIGAASYNVAHGTHSSSTNGNSSNNLSVSPNPKSGIVRNHSFRSLKAFKSPPTSLSNTALSSSNRGPRESISSVRSDGLPNNLAGGIMFPGVKCHICDGTRFEPLSRNGSQDKSYYCVDCKTLLNSFR